MVLVRVAADEWIMAPHGSGAVLVTDGFSGCVGVAFIGRTRCLLAHVYSNCTLTTWRAYKVHLERMRTTFCDGGEPIVSMNLVYSDDNETETVVLLRGFLYWHFDMHSKIFKDGGCSVDAGAIRQVQSRVADPNDPSKSIRQVVTKTGDMTFLPKKSSPHACGAGAYSATVQTIGLVGGKLDGTGWPVQ